MRRALLTIAGLALVCLAVFAVLFYDRTIEHGERQKLEQDVATAMARPSGPDYAAVIALYHRARYFGADERALSIATTIVAACQSGRPPCHTNKAQVLAAAWATIGDLSRRSASDDIRGLAKLWIDRRDLPLPDPQPSGH
jgi:hypothetical protein